MKLKWILTGLAAVLVAAVVAGYAVLSSMNFEDLRAVVEAEAKAATGRELTLAGPIDLKVSLSPTIAVEDVRFANAPWGSRAEMMSLKRFEVEVALLPLISGEIQVKRLVLVEPDILLETDKKGRGNWVMAGAEPGQGAAAEGPAAALPSFDSVVIRDGRVRFRNGVTGREMAVRLSELNGRAAGRSEPVNLAAAGSFNGTPFRLDGSFGSFDALIGGKPFPVKLAGEAAGARFTAEGTIAKPLTGQGFDLRVSAEGDSLAPLSAVAGRELPPLGPYSLSAQVRETDGRYALTGLAARVGDSDLSGAGTLTLTGKRPAIAGSFTAGVLDLADFRAASAQSVPAEPNTGETGTPAPKTAKSAPSATATGEREVATPAQKPRSEPAAPGGQEYLFSEEPLPFDALKAVDAKVDLSIGELRLKPALVLSDVKVALDLHDGKLTVGSFDAGLAGGRLAGDLSVDAGKKAPPLALDATATGIDYGALLKALDVTDAVTGRTDASAKLRGAGASMRAIVSGLSGRVEVVGGEGRVRNTLFQTGGVGVLDMLSAWREGDNDLRVNCVVARLPIQSGVVDSGALLIDTQAVTVGGTGKIDLARESLDLKATPQAKRTSLMSLAVPFLITGSFSSPSVVPDPVGTAVGAAKIAGMFINPLAAGALIVLGSESGGANPCAVALRRAGQSAGDGGGQTTEKSTAGQATEGVTDTLQGVGEGVTGTLKGVGEGIGKGLKSLFGD